MVTSDVQAGRQPVTAPLSDPTARPGEDHLAAVDAGKAFQIPSSSQGAFVDSFGRRVNNEPEQTCIINERWSSFPFICH